MFLQWAMQRHVATNIAATLGGMPLHIRSLPMDCNSLSNGESAHVFSLADKEVVWQWKIIIIVLPKHLNPDGFLNSTLKAWSSAHWMARAPVAVHHDQNQLVIKCSHVQRLQYTIT